MKEPMKEKIQVNLMLTGQGKSKPESGLAKIDSAYEAQAQAFLDRFQIKFRATLSDSKVAPWSDEVAGERHHYRVTLSKSQRYQFRMKSQLARLTFDYWGSIMDCADGKHPTPYDVLACISSDVQCDFGFLEWCDNMGFERDSIKALQAYRRCSALSKRLKAFLTSEEIEALGEIQ